MWVFTNNAFLSIVQHHGSTEWLMVRSRIEGDIENVFPEADVRETPDADYRFRAAIPRRLVAERLEETVEDINYGNFKKSIAHDCEGRWRHDVYLQVWSVMARAQREAINLRKAVKTRFSGNRQPPLFFDE